MTSVRFLGGLFFWGCYYGPTRPLLLPLEDEPGKRKQYTVGVEAPKPRFILDSTEHKTVNTASIGIRLPVGKQSAVELSTSGVQFEFLYLKRPGIQFGTAHKLGQGSQGDPFGSTPNSHLIALMHVAQVNLKAPFITGLWLGTGLEYDLRGYTYSSEMNSESAIESITFREYDFFYVQSLYFRKNDWLLYGSFASPPFLNKPGYTVRFNDWETPQATGVASRKAGGYSVRVGLAREIK